jgi:membrane protease YdiL (CAAX protease family)
MSPPDLFCLVFIAFVLLLDSLVVWPTFVRRSQVDLRKARVWLWSSWIILLWTMTAAVVALWLFEARAWSALRLTNPHGWRLWAASGLVMALASYTLYIVVRILSRPRPRRVQLANPDVARMAPRAGSEMGLWVALSLTAGICEEFVFRGYLIWAFTPMLGLWGAAALSLVAFTISHTYQGPKGMVAVAALGLLFTLVVLCFGSLWPAMALHALVDAGQGLTTWLVLRRAPAVVTAA